MATAKLGPVTAAPIRVQPAYDNREAVRRTILELAPYPIMIAGAGIRPCDRGWEITGGASVIGKLPDEHVRISLLWRAITFRDEREAHAYDEHEDDLDAEAAISRFCDDLTERGVAFTPPPHDPFNNQAWSSLLTQTYLVSAFV